MWARREDLRIEFRDQRLSALLEAGIWRAIADCRSLTRNCAAVFYFLQTQKQN